MALKVYYSDRIEDLAEDLKRRLIEERCGPGSDPFMFSQVVVPNTNIAKWLQIRAFADSPALCMGVEFPFIEERLFGLLSDSVGDGKRPQLLPMNAYANAIMSILLKDDDEKLAPFRRYIADGDAGPLKIDSRSKARMAWQLAVRLADLMDKYEVHREDVVMGWLDEGLAAGPQPSRIRPKSRRRRSPGGSSARMACSRRQGTGCPCASFSEGRARCGHAPLGVPSTSSGYLRFRRFR